MRVVLVGLPGVGKSTVGRLLAEATGGRVEEEDPASLEYVEAALLDPGQYAVLGQVELMLDKARTELAPDLGTVWQEDDTRYLHHVWTPALVRDGRLDSRAEGILHRLGVVLDATCPHPAGIVALELSPKALAQRIVTRGRTYETSSGEIRAGFSRLLAALYREHRRYVMVASAGDPPLWSVDASPAPDMVARDVIACTQRLRGGEPRSWSG